jgi:hypothetical protein
MRDVPVSRCDDPTCWRTPHDRSDHTDPIAALTAEIERIEDLMHDAPPYLERMLAQDRALVVRQRDELRAERLEVAA